MHGMVESERVSPFVNNMCCAKKSNTLKTTAVVASTAAAATLATDVFIGAKVLKDATGIGIAKNIGNIVKNKEVILPLIKKAGIIGGVAAGVYLACAGIKSLFTK